MADANHSTHPHSFEERLSRLEATVETFVLTVSKDIQDQNSNINALRKAIQEQIKPQYQNWIAAAGVLLLVVGMFGSVYLRDLNRFERDMQDMRQWRLGYMVEDAKDVASSRERLIALERQVFNNDGHDEWRRDE